MSPSKNLEAQARARRKGGVGGIPPRPSVPPERSGGGQSGFSAKWVLTFSNKHHNSKLFNFFAGDKTACSPLFGPKD
ncbi:hypothetical protein EPN83_00380 [Patescibacteria group bacterium]|nr:MAG: hypothetical protein EPN83_00380 [Patescibacteria group bacterium]